ncbi:MAG: hypothetical protein K2L14_09910 [Duncaniella sp.]|nr:hypothetical protein [Duncaniella sp.]
MRIPARLSYIIAAILLYATSCTGVGTERAGLIQENSSWRVTTGSFSAPEMSVTFVSDTNVTDFPVLISPTPLLDRMYSTGVNDYFGDTSPALFTRTTVWNPAVLSLLDPEIAAEQVMMKARQSLNTCRDWPLEAPDLSWITSLRDLSLALDDQSVIDSLISIARVVIDREIEVAFDRNIALFRGLLFSMPARVSRTDILEIYSLRVNIDRAAAMKVLGEILPEEEGTAYLSLSGLIADAVNDRFWIPEKGRYGCALWGQYYPMLITASDNLAQSMAILYGIATPDMAQSILNSMPLTDEGAPDYYPVSSGTLPSYSLATQIGLYNSASLMHGTRRSLLGLASSAAAIFSGSGSGSSVASALLKSFGGLSFTPEGLSVSPFIPEIFTGEKIFTSLIYRTDTLDLHITGTGSRVVRMEIDGRQTLSHVIPDSLSGSHRIDVVMANNTPEEKKLIFAEAAHFPPRPRIDSVGPDRYTVISQSKDYNYVMAVNGITCRVISDGAFSVPPSASGLKAITAMSLDKDGYSSVPAKSHLVFNPSDTMIVDRHDIPYELRKAVAARIERNSRRRMKRKDEIPTHLELTRDLNTELSFTVKAPHSGEYYVDIAYWRPSVSECFISELHTSDSIAGCFVMPSQKGFSNPLTVSLKKGRNKLKLMYHPLPSGNLQSGACIEYIRFLPKKLSR